jgi:hypothetical protein
VLLGLVEVCKDVAVTRIRSQAHSLVLLAVWPRTVRYIGALFQRENERKAMVLQREKADNRRSAALAVKHTPRPLTQHGVGASEAMPETIVAYSGDGGGR